jgi:hypothetical protein
MTSIVSIVTVFMATFVLVFGYLTFAEPEGVAMEADAPAAISEQSAR